LHRPDEGIRDIEGTGELRLLVQGRDLRRALRKRTIRGGGGGRGWGRRDGARLEIESRRVETENRKR